MDQTLIIRVIVGCLALCILVVFLVYIGFLGGVLRKCCPSSRTMRPGMVWLLLIPLFNLVWSFVVVFGVADSLGNEFRLRNIPTPDTKPGKSIGIAMAVSAVLSLIPFVAFAHLILWIVYWVKIANFSRQLDLFPISAVVPSNPPRI